MNKIKEKLLKDLKKYKKEDGTMAYDKRKTHANKKFHLKCYRKAIKIAKSQITKGIGNL